METASLSGDTDPQLELSADELALLLETTTPDERDLHTSGDDNGSSTDATTASSIRVLDAKRARRSEIEKLSRRRRQSTLREMREEVQRLERQMNAMLDAARDAQRADDPRPRPQVDQTPTTATTTTTELEALRQHFVKLSLDAQRLEREKNDLRRILRSRQLLSQSVKSLASAFTEDWDESSWRHELEHRTYEPLPREQLFRIMRESFEAITAFGKRTDLVSSGNAFMGWVDHRHVEDDSGMFFSFTKVFRGRDPEQVMLSSWDIFTHEDLLRKSLGLHRISVQLRMLQEPNDDIVVLYRRLTNRHVGKSHHTVYILFRLRTDDGYTICFRTIPAPGIQESLEETDTWIDIFHWVHFRYVQDEATGDCVACEVAFGGWIHGRFIDTIENFLLNAFATVVRWENAAIAPMFLGAASSTNWSSNTIY